MRSTLAVLLALGGLFAGCSSSDHSTADRNRDRDYLPMSRGSEREDANSLQSDPVCNRTVSPNTASRREYYEGKIYYFDSEECWKKFHDRPQAYVPGTGEERRTQDVR